MKGANEDEGKAKKNKGFRHDEIRILQVKQIRKEHKQGKSIEDLIREYEPERPNLIELIIKNIVWPTEITEELRIRVIKKHGFKNIHREVTENNEWNRLNREEGLELNLPINGWIDKTIEGEIDRLCQYEIDRTEFIIQKIKRKYELINSNTATIKKLKTANLIRKARKRGKTIKAIARKYKLTESAVIMIINHEVSSTEVTDQLINKLKRYEIKKGVTEEWEAEKIAKSKAWKITRKNIMLLEGKKVLNKAQKPEKQ